MMLNPLHPLKDVLDIFVTLLGIMMAIRLEQFAKALAAIFFILLGIAMDAKLLQPENVPLFKAVIPLGIFTL